MNLKYKIMEELNPENQEYQEPSEEENNIQEEEEPIKIFDSKYDNEFIGLLNEIGIRLPNFSKQDRLKIKSWISILTIPCNTNETKKNRNLYGIKLINQMVQGKLEEPFIKYANGPNDLRWLSPIDVKTELCKKFFEEIDFEKIENYGINQQKNFLANHPDIAERIRNSQHISKNSNSEIYQNSQNNFNNNNINLNTNSENIIMNDNNEFMGNFDGNNISNENQNYQEESNQYNVNNYITKINNNKNYNDKIKLINIIRDLEQKVIERDEIIEYQNKQIAQIQNRINFIQNLQNNNF